jgi:hypothetical protein
MALAPALCRLDCPTSRGPSARIAWLAIASAIVLEEAVPQETPRIPRGM